MEKKLVSIITPVYNCENYIKDTIDSVIDQTYENWEMILVDDMSSDKSCEIIEKYITNDSRIKLIRLKENSGAAIARNVAMKEANGRYLAFLDGDDLWHPEKLNKQIGFMEKNKIAFSFTSYEVIDNEGNSLNKIVKVPYKMTYNDYLKNTIIQTVTVIIDKTVTGEINMPLLKRRQDFATWLSILKRNIDAYGLDESLAKYRRATGSLSSNKFKAMKLNWYVYREVENLSLLKTINCFIGYAYNACKKRIYIDHYKKSLFGK